ncbi:unnamed protein product, partial [Discosporangium mesarthrocarpum]
MHLPVLLYKEVEKEPEPQIAKTQVINERLMAQLDESRSKVKPASGSKKIEKKETDLNGVNPLSAMLGAAVAAGMSFGAWKATVFLAEAYYRQAPSDSDILAVQRIT